MDMKNTKKNLVNKIKDNSDVLYFLLLAVSAFMLVFVFNLDIRSGCDIGGLANYCN